MEKINFDNLVQTVNLPMQKDYCYQHLDAEKLPNGSCSECVRQKRDQDWINLLAAQHEDNIVNQKLAAKIPYITANLLTYKPKHYQEVEVYNYLKSYKFMDNIILLGTPGCGKTFIASAILNTAIRKGKSAHFADYTRLADIYYSDDKKEWEYLIKSSIIFIDEVGRVVTKDGTHLNKILDELLYERYKSRIPTILVGNITDEELKNIVLPSTFSRLNENCFFKYCTWNDYRLTGEK